MDTSRLLDPSVITDRLPTGKASSIVSNLTDVTTDLAGQIGDHAGQLGSHVADLDLSSGMRRGRGLAASIIPWVDPPRSRSRRRWIVIAGAVVAVAAVVAVLRGRSGEQQTARDDWATAPSSNGTNATSPADRRESVASPA